MSFDWPLKRISEVANFENNKRIPLKSLDREKRQGIYPYYGASGVVDHIDDFIFDGRYLLISEDGENLRTRNTPIAFQASGKFWVNNHAHILSEKEEGILDYLEYYFSVLNIGAYITGAVQPKLNKANLDKIEIPIPPKDERLKLNNILNSLKYKVALNSETNQTLEQMAQAIFKSWFVDFDPVKAKMNGEQPEGMDAATASLFPEKLDSETDIPEGWRLSEIGDEVAVVGGGTPSKKNDDFWVDGHIHWTSPKDLSGVQDKVLLDTASKLTEAGLKKVSSGLLPVDTVLLSSRAPVGYLALAKVPLAVNQGYIAMKCEKVLPPEFVLQWCVHRMDEIKQRASGSTFAEISKKNFKPISVVVPSEDVLNAYQKLVKPLYDAITSNARQSEQLSTLRDTLLPKLLSGEIELGTSEELVEAI
ncbi:restriction endonuclease subunit S [Vibrio parahaemolyticus]|nr:restriction endonuclease subunit S [Vibrio parahaemolyticus]